MMCVFLFFFVCLSPRFGPVKWTLFLIGNVRKNPKKVTEKREFLRKTSFRPNRFFYMVVNQKLITFKFWRNLIKNTTLMRLNFKFLQNSFLISSSYIQILTKIRQDHEYLQIILYCFLYHSLKIF
ncbi:Uncharacterized protein FWK35_00009646, partial [Aphis craccivora]